MMRTKNMWVILLGLLLFLMMWATCRFMSVKILLVLLITVWGIVRNDEKITLNNGVLWWFYIYISSNLLFLGISFLNGNRGISKYLNTELIEPIIYVALIACISKRDFHNLKYEFVYGSLFLYVYLFLGFFSVNGMLPFRSMPLIYADFGGVLPFGLVKADAEFVQWLYFLIPGNIAIFFFRSDIQKGIIRKLVIVNFLLSYLVMLIILKTAMILVVGIVTLLSFVFYLYTTKRIVLTRNELIVCLISIFLSVVFVQVFKVDSFFENTIMNKVLISFGETGYKNSYGVIDNGGSVRIKQAIDLIDTWRLRPIFGWGTGANSLQFQSFNGSRAYELTYLKMLMNRGIVGTIVFFSLISWLFFKLYRYVKRDIMKLESIFILFGLLGILIANGTNPYIASFDKLIILFLPLLIINLNSRKPDILKNGCSTFL